MSSPIQKLLKTQLILGQGSSLLNYPAQPFNFMPYNVGSVLALRALQTPAAPAAAAPPAAAGGAAGGAAAAPAKLDVADAYFMLGCAQGNRAACTSMIMSKIL